MIFDNNQPAGRLVPVFSAHDGLNAHTLVLALTKTAAVRGETALVIDAMDGAIMKRAGIITGISLGDVLYRNANIRDAKYISKNEHFTAASAGDANLEALLGSLAALSLGYDWVFVGVPSGCTPAHVRLAGASDTALLMHASKSDKFMRAYWMLDAIRARAPKFDPLMIIEGDEDESFETYDMFTETVRGFLGASPALGGILTKPDDADIIALALLEALREETPLLQKTAS